MYIANLAIFIDQIGDFCTSKIGWENVIIYEVYILNRSLIQV